MDDLKKLCIGHFFCTMSSIVHHFKSIGEFKLELQSRKKLNSGRNWRYFILCDLEIWWMTLENNRGPLLYHIKLCASFQSHWWSQTWVTVRKRSIRVKIGNFLSHVTSKFDEWPWKTIGHLCIISKPWVNSIWSYSLETLNSGQNRQFFVPCDLEI